MTSRNFDGYLMLSLSSVLITLSLSLTYLFVFIYILFIAITAKCGCMSVDRIVVLGKKLINNKPDNDYLSRLNRVLVTVTDVNNAHIYLLGGITGGATISESKAGKVYLENNNIVTNNIYIEETSIDTLDNMKRLKEDILNAEKDIILISNRYHLARASVMAQGFGFNTRICAAENSFFLNKDVFIMFGEAFFLHWYLCGRVYAKLTNNQRMLARIQ